MHAGTLAFAQLMDHMPPMVFERCVARYGGNRKVKSVTCMDQYLCMAFAPLTFRKRLRDIEVCPRSQAVRLNHMGIRGRFSATPWPVRTQRAIDASTATSLSV